MVNPDNGTITTAAVPEMTPERDPSRGAVIPMITEDQRPTRGLTPTMALQAIALERREKATVRPARDSWRGVGGLVVMVDSLLLLAAFNCSAELSAVVWKE